MDGDVDPELVKEGAGVTSTHSILADVSADISELKKNPISVMEQGDGAPVAILCRNEPVFYAVPASAYEELMDKLEDIELAETVRARLDEPEIDVSLGGRDKAQAAIENIMSAKKHPITDEDLCELKSDKPR